MERKNEPRQPDYMLLAANLAEELINTYHDPNSAIHGLQCYVRGQADKPLIVGDCHSPDIALTVIRELETRQQELSWQAPPDIDFDSRFYEGIRRAIE